MKILFLDFDGVLNSYGFNEPAPDWAKLNHPYTWIEKSKVQLLRQVVNETKCKIVISSSWRTVHKIVFIQRALEELSPGIGAFVIGQTPILRGPPRGKEIQAWLNLNAPTAVYAIIDDTPDMLDSQKDNFVRTAGFVGITEAEVKQLIKILNGPTGTMVHSGELLESGGGSS